MSGGCLSRLVVGAYFDGARHHHDGPYAIICEGGLIRAIEPAGPGEAVDAAFVLPTLVDAHVHVFLDGAELDPARRKAALAADDEATHQVAAANAEAAWRAGLGIVRDAGDPREINHALRAELARRGHGLRVRSPGPALHRPGRYGSFLGTAIADDRDIAEVVRALCAHTDDVKVLLTGVIDFASGTVKGKPQFDAEAAGRIVATARAAGRPAFVHCNGAEGLRIAAAAGFDSIEHGYLMDEETLRMMAGEGVAWTPTLAPVAAQRALPALVSGFGPEILAMLDRILAAHAEAIARAAQLGVPLLCGSDAGGQGVPHGSGLIDEMLLMAAAGAPMELVLAGATALPRARWGEPLAGIAVGLPLSAVTLPESPFDLPEALRAVERAEPRPWAPERRAATA